VVTGDDLRPMVDQLAGEGHRDMFSGEEWPDKIVSANAFRDYPFVSSHLRTFYAGLYQRIRPVDLQDSAGRFFTTAGDCAQMWALHEMAGPHGRFVDEVLYHYNRANPLNDDKLDRVGQVRTEVEIRGKARYGRVPSPFSAHAAGLSSAHAAGLSSAHAAGLFPVPSPDERAGIRWV